MTEKIETVIDEIRDPHSEFSITGILIQYVTICERECWFYLHGIHGDQGNTHLTVGRQIDKETYTDTETRIIDGTIAPDILEDGRIIEVKKGSASKEAAKYQLGFYLWYFETFKDDNREGVIAIPKEKERQSVDLTSDLREQIEEKMVRIWELWNQEDPPEFEEKPVCDSCAYKDFCWR